MTEENAQAQPAQKNLYVSPNAPALTVVAEKKKYVFEGGKLELSDPEDIKDFEKALNLPQISMLVRKVNAQQAAAIVAKHKEQAKNLGASGTFSTGHMDEMRNQMLRSRDAQIANLSPEGVEAFNEQLQETGMMLTEKSNIVPQEIKPEEGSGEKADADAKKESPLTNPFAKKE